MFDAHEVPAVSGEMPGAQSLATAGGPSSVHLLDRLNAVFKHRRLAGTAFLLVVAAMMIQTYSTVPIYRTQSRIQIDDEKTTDLSNLNSDLYWQDSTEYKKTQFQILQSRALGARVVAKLGLNGVAAPAPAPHDPMSLLREARVGVGAWVRGLIWKREAGPPAAAAQDPDVRLAGVVNGFLGGLSINPDADTRLVYIQYTHSDPVFAARAANTVATEYIEMNLEHRLENLQKMLAWVTDQVDKQGVVLARNEDALAQYREANNAISLGRQNIVGQRLNDLNSQATQARTVKQQKQILYDQVRNADPTDDAIDASPSIGANAAVVTAKSDVRTAQDKVDALTSKGFDNGYGPLRDAKSEVNAARQRLIAARRRVIESIKQEYSTAALNERDINGALEEAKNEQSALDRKGVSYDQLMRQAESTRDVYNSLLTKQKELTVVANSRQNNVQLIERAEVPKVPIAPQPRREWLTAILMGTVVAFGLAFGLEYLDDTVKTPEDITRRLRVPLLGLVPAIRGERVPILTEPVPHDFGEAFRSLRTSLVFTSSTEHTRVIAVTSSQPLEGKTTTAANLALALALGGARVLLIDADMRRPGLHKTIGVANGTGLSHVLQGEARVRDAVQRTAEKNLVMMTAGHTPPNPSELLSSERMSNFLSNLEHGPFDWVIIDTPPVLAVTDAVILAPKVSGVVFVVGSEMTRRVHAERALETLRGARPRTDHRRHEPG